MRRRQCKGYCRSRAMRSIEPGTSRLWKGIPGSRDARAGMTRECRSPDGAQRNPGASPPMELSRIALRSIRATTHHSFGHDATVAPAASRPSSGESLRFLGFLSPTPGRPFDRLGHSAQLALKVRYWQILTGHPSIETDIQHILLKSGGISADPD